MQEQTAVPYITTIDSTYMEAATEHGLQYNTMFAKLSPLFLMEKVHVHPEPKLSRQYTKDNQTSNCHAA